MTQIEAEKGVDYHVIDSPLDPSPETVDDDASRSRWGDIILAACVFGIIASLATSVFAGDTETFADGVFVKLVPVDVGYVVEYQNGYSYLEDYPPFVLEVEGQKVLVDVDPFTLDEPDLLQVQAPVGFYCDPCEVYVQENKLGQIFLYPEVGA